MVVVVYHQVYFNSQPHKEADQIFDNLRKSVLHFNSQPHKEADRAGLVSHVLVYISTHSLTRRLTCRVIVRVLCNPYFNSQPHKEAD